MKLDKGSTAHFALGAVLFNDDQAAEACIRRIDGLAKELHFTEDFEFHFHKCSDAIRTRFLAAVSGHAFSYHFCLIDKRKLRGKEWTKRESFWHRGPILLLESLRPLLLNANVFIDKASDRRFNQEVAKMLKRHAGDKDGLPAVKDVQPRFSHKHRLIQLADMVCGAAVRSCLAADAHASRFLDLIRAREGAVRVWP